MGARTIAVVAALSMIVGCAQGRMASQPSERLSQRSNRIDFDAQIRPLLEAQCSPCHFAGGKMYDQLPFDRPATIHKLGTALFTRIKDEGERAIIRAFLAQPAEAPSRAGAVPQDPPSR